MYEALEIGSVGQMGETNDVSSTGLSVWKGFLDCSAASRAL